jgi:hypothetical protein
VGPRAGLDDVGKDCDSLMKHITPCGQNAQFLNIKVGGTYSNHCSLKDYSAFIVNETRVSA